MHICLLAGFFRQTFSWYAQTFSRIYTDRQYSHWKNGCSLLIIKIKVRIKGFLIFLVPLISNYLQSPNLPQETKCGCWSGLCNRKGPVFLFLLQIFNAFTFSQVSLLYIFVNDTVCNISNMIFPFLGLLEILWVKVCNLCNPLTLLIFRICKGMCKFPWSESKKLNFLKMFHPCLGILPSIGDTCHHIIKGR